MKKILHISKFYYPYFGGIEDVVYNIVDELRHQYEQRVICFNHERTGTIRTLDNGVEIVRVNAPFIIASQPISLSYLGQLRKEIQSFRPDVIHVHFPNPLVTMYLMLIDLQGAKLIIHWHADVIGKSVLYRLCQPMERKALKRADAIIATSKQYVEQSQPLQAFKDKISILPNIVNEEKMRLLAGEEGKVQGIRDLYPGKKIVLFMGRHVEYKGIQFLIKAAKWLDEDCIVLIGGTGVLTQALKQKALPLKDKIQFIGRVPSQEMKHYMYAASVFAFPSIDRREAFGVVLAEALYCGIPAVSFRIEGSGTTWVNQNGKTGIVVDRMDAKPYAEAINSLLRNEDLRKQYGENAKQWVRANFLKDKIQTLSKLYD